MQAVQLLAVAVGDWEEDVDSVGEYPRDVRAIGGPFLKLKINKLAKCWPMPPPYTADPVSSLGRTTSSSSPAVPGPVSTLGHVVLPVPGGAAASLSTHNPQQLTGVRAA